MISRIIVSIIFLCMLIAIPLSLVGIHYVDMGGGFRDFLVSCNVELNDFKIEIPSIPTIPRMEDKSGFMLVLDLLISFFNGLITIVNILITGINVIIQLLEFLFIVLKNLIIMTSKLEDIPVPDITSSI